jgi:hypothetical protein
MVLLSWPLAVTWIARRATYIMKNVGLKSILAKDSCVCVVIRKIMKETYHCFIHSQRFWR